MFPLVSLIFLKKSLVFSILLFSSISLHWSVRKAFLSFLPILWNSAFWWIYLSFSPLLFLFFSQLFVRPPQTSILPFFILLLFLGYGFDHCLLCNGTNLHPCWSFNGPEPGGSESKREKEADIPWFTRKANRALFLGLALPHVGTRCPLEWVKAQCTFSRGY